MSALFILKIRTFHKKTIDFLGKMRKIKNELHTSLIKSGGGNGPMKPGNLLIQGAKSGGNDR